MPRDDALPKGDRDDAKAPPLPTCQYCKFPTGNPHRVTIHVGASLVHTFDLCHVCVRRVAVMLGLQH